MIYNSSMLASAATLGQSLLLSLFPGDGGTTKGPGCGAFAHAQMPDYPRRGCFPMLLPADR